MSGSDRYEVRFDPEALRDLRRIADYMTEVRGPDDAEALVRAIIERADALQTFPLRGGTLKELLHMENSILRQVIYRHYRIVYAVFESVVTVLMVVDGRRDLRPLFRDRLGAADPPPA